MFTKKTYLVPEIRISYADFEASILSTSTEINGIESAEVEDFEFSIFWD